MRIYVAAKLREDVVGSVRALYARLRALGHVITHDWTQSDAPAEATAEFWTRCAVGDAQGVESADAVIVLHHDKGKGLFVELGMAIALRKKVIAVGNFAHSPEALCIFYWAPGVIRVSDEDAALAALN